MTCKELFAIPFENCVFNKKGNNNRQ